MTAITITPQVYRQLVAALGQQAAEDIAWSEKERAIPDDPRDFAREVIYVIANSGMKYAVAQGIFKRSMAALVAGTPVIEVFRHKGKAAAMETIWRDRERLREEYIAAEDKLAYAETLPWIGGITAYHVVKNFGMDVAKPDVHIQRLADHASCTPHELCDRLAKALDVKVATVDTILWRACSVGYLNSVAGTLHLPEGVSNA